MNSLTVLAILALAATAIGGGARASQAADPTGYRRDVKTRDYCGETYTVDASGRISRIGAEALRLLGPSLLANATIDSLTTWHSYTGFSPARGLDLLGLSETYYLSDGTSWRSGAGSFTVGFAELDHVEVSGTTIRYYFSPPLDGIICRHSDFNCGDHSSQGTLGSSYPLLLETQIGSNIATLKGRATIVSNDPTDYATFNYFGAPVGTEVPFNANYFLYSPGGWTPDAFDRPRLDYRVEGKVWFVRPVPPRSLVTLSVSGAVDVTEASTFQYRAFARYDDATLRDVTATAEWSIEPPALGSVTQGLLTTGSISAIQETAIIRANYVEGSTGVGGQVVILIHNVPPDPRSTTWSMYQADCRHTGHVAVSLRPHDFRLKWQQPIASGADLNPVTAADGKVFCSLVSYFVNVPSMFFALDASDGSTLWSKSFGEALVNPPSYADGKVYLQTGNRGRDTWLESFDASTGALVFKSPHNAQGEQYLAPTIADGKVYVNGGYYGGMYGFDGETGAQLWFANLPQYNLLTPTVDRDFAYAYVGLHEPGLYAIRRTTGERAYMIPDRSFEWDGWSMNEAPVVGRHSNLLAIHDGRLIDFDPATRVIRWQLQRDFRGQPSVAHDVVYAIDAGQLVALDEVTHADLWSWQPPEGALTGTLVITDTHVFASTERAVYAVDLTSHQEVWSYPAAGHLALSDRMLYVASSNGVLNAIEVAPTNLPPDCSAAVADIRNWPPNHELTPVRISGVVDPEGEAVQLSVTGITEDELVEGTGDGNTCPDAVIDPDGSARVRRERAGPGNGRVYMLTFTASDPLGGSCEGRVTVCVPGEQGQGSCVDDGQSHNALASCPLPDPLGGSPGDEDLRVLDRRGRRIAFSYGLGRREEVELVVFDIAGRRIATVESGIREAGHHRVDWNATGQPRGIYFARLRTGTTARTRIIAP